MTDKMVEKISKETGCDIGKVQEIVTLALKELDLVAASDYQVTTAALSECLLNFGPEACFHLAGILESQDDCTNEPGQSLMPETVERMFVCVPREEKEGIKNRWVEDLEKARKQTGWYERHPGDEND